MPTLEAVPAQPRRPDAWSAGNTHCAMRYCIQAEAQPALPCQVLNLFAMQYLVPSQITMLRRGDELHIEVDVDGLSAHRAEVIGEKMRNLIDVHSVVLRPLDHTLAVARATA
ncbi:hypothetical protein PS3A_10590 [Pseudomonas sp. 3A(2025)]